MNLKGRYSILGGILVTFLIVFFVPFESQSTGRCQKCLDCNSLIDEINSLQVVQKDMVVVDSHKVGNKTFQQLQLEKLKEIIREQSHLKMSIMKEPIDILGNKDWVLDCVTWNVIKQKNHQHHKFQNLQKNASTIPVKNHKTEYIKKSLPGLQNRTSILINAALNADSQRLIAILHVIITKIKHHLKKNSIHILDLYCGELTWMETFLKTRNDVHYTGVDNVQEVIGNNKKQHTATLPLAEFYFYDALQKPIWEKFDLVLAVGVFDWLAHEQALQLLSHISISASSYLLISDEIGSFNRGKNHSKSEYSIHNFEEKPFFLDSPVCVNSNKLKRDIVAFWTLPLKQQVL